jgi:hypothetical protein
MTGPVMARDVRYGVFSPNTRIPIPMTIRPKAAEARTVMRLAVELMGFSIHFGWEAPQPWH